MERIIVTSGRIPRQRTTLYADADDVVRQRSFDAAAARASAVSRDKNVHMAALS
jgi:FO synthase